ncbi:hydroxylysine kinase-like [Petromyzon marinus]|uniref:hydroxylysine kinase-like n=1 Tax=Petromyzon marinus TaxID=7757 RepID=UPI003F716C60
MQAAPQDDGREHEKPCLSESRAAELVERLYGVSVAGVSPLASYVDQNYRVLARDGRQFVLKVTNTWDSQRPQMLEVQMAMMRFLRERGFPMQEVVDNVSGKIMSLESIDCGEGEKEFNVRLLTNLPGVLLSRVLADGSLYYQVGKLAASIHQALQQVRAHERLLTGDVRLQGFIFLLLSVKSPRRGGNNKIIKNIKQ